MNHRHLLFVVFCAVLLRTCSVRAYAEDLSEICGLVKTVAAQADDIRCRHPEAVCDHFYVLRRFKEVSYLEVQLTHRWRDVLANLDSVAGTDMEKTVVLLACGKLAEEEYVAFLDAVITLVEQGRLGRQYFSFVENPVDETSEGWAVLVRKAEDPYVQSIIKRARALFQDREDMVNEFDQMLSGESRRRLEQSKSSMRAAQTSGSSQSQEPVVQKPFVQNITQTKAVEEPEDDGTSFVRQAGESLVKVAHVETDEPEEKMRGFVLPVAIGFIVFFACVGVWGFRRHW